MLLSNTFNSINCQNAFGNILNLCPVLTTIVINCYHINIPLFIDGDVIFWAEGTTKGDWLAMIFFAVGILPLICRLDGKDCSQIWYADDTAACGTLSHICDWWIEICSLDLVMNTIQTPQSPA